MRSSPFSPASLDLLALPSVAVSHLRELPPLAACYFVIGHDGTVLYIGRTGNLQKRFVTHHRQWEFSQEPQPVRIAWLLMTDRGLLGQVERLCIDYWVPKYNQSSIYGAQGRVISLTLRLPESVIGAIDREIARRLVDAPGVIQPRTAIVRDALVLYLRDRERHGGVDV